MDKYEVYCRIEFIEDILLKVSEGAFDEENNIYRAIFDFIGSNCYLFYDISEKEFYQKIKSKNNNSNMFRKLLKKMQAGNSEFISLQNEFIYMKEDENYFKNKVSEIYFLSKNDEFAKNISENYGLVSADINSINNILFLFNFSIYACTEKGKISSWNFIQELKHPFNSMVIADNYILQKKELYAENLYKIFNIFLPKELNKNIFDLTIIIEKDTITNSELKSVHKNILENIQKPYKINLSIIKVSKNKLHDRNIITNQFWLNSGYGFTLFKNKKIRTETHITAFPRTFNKRQFSKIPIPNKHNENPVNEMYEILKKQYIKLNNEATNIIISNSNKLEIIEYIGNKNNRLLNL